MLLFEFWRKRKERGELLQRSRQKSLHPSELKRLLSDAGVRASLDDSVASLLPPVGVEVFRRFTETSTEDNERHPEDKEQRDKHKQAASELEAGKPLPFFLGDPPPDLLHTPLVELDPFYQPQTFMVVGYGKLVHRFDSGSSCSIFSPSNRLRAAAIRVLLHPLFSLMVAVTILTNCVFMTMETPPQWSFILGSLSLAIYTLELLVKLVARGILIGPFSSLRDPWNWLDVLVVITGSLSFVITSWGKLLTLYSVSQVMKLLPLLPGMKATIRILIQLARRLLGVMVLTLFGLCLLALVGQHLFMGNLRQKCVMWPINTTEPMFYDNGTAGKFDYNSFISNQSNHYFIPGQLDAPLCGNGTDSGSCPEGFTCLRAGVNPNYGYTSFDNFGWSLLSMVRMMTQDFWENLLMLSLRSAGKSTLFFFVVLVFPVCFFLVSFIVVKVAMVISEWEDTLVAEARLRDRSFRRIQRALQGNKEQQTTGGVETSETQDKEKKEGSCSQCCVSCLTWNCCGCWCWIKQKLRALVMNPFFDLMIVICLVANIIFMALLHYPLTYEFERVIFFSQWVFFWIFFVEMTLKILALDPYGYFKVSWNIFDSIIVVLSFAGLMEVGILHFVYVLRIFRLARWWHSFHLLLKMVWQCLKSLMNLVLLLLILVFIFSVLGMQLFQEDYETCVCRISVDCELPRWHMSDFFHSFLIIYRVLVGEWIETLWDCMQVSSQAACMPFFMVFMIVGNLLMLTLFLSVLLSSSIAVSLEQPEEKDKNNAYVASKLCCRALCSLFGREVADPSAADSPDGQNKDCLALDVVTSGPSGSEGQSHSTPIAKDEAQISEDKEDRGDQGDDGLDPPAVPKPGEDVRGNMPEDCCWNKCYQCCPILDVGKSHGAGRAWSNFRRTCLTIVQHQGFEAFMIVVILLSSLALVFEDSQPRRVLKVVVETADKIFTFIFLLEMLLKWSALGFRRYFTDAWCWLDFIILQVSLMCLCAGVFGVHDLGAAVCSLRATIPLRTLSRSQGLRVVIQTVVHSLPKMFDGVLVALMVYLAFSIVGVELFAGKFFYCFNETAEEYYRQDDVNNRSDCVSMIFANFTEVRWKNLKLNFDSVDNGFLSLFLMAASTSWMDIMYAAVDATGVESQPAYEANIYMYFYFIFFTISTFFIFIYIIAIIVYALQARRLTGKPLFASENQIKRFEALKNSFCGKSTGPPRPQNSCRAGLFDLVTSVWFEFFMVIIILLNMVVFMVETPDLSQQTEELLYWLNFIFIIIFLIEFILKIIALGRHYFTSRWNILDFIVLLVTIIGLFLSDLMEKYFFSSSIVAMLRLVRVVRVVHLIRYSKGVRTLVKASVMSLPALFNISLVLFIVTYCFSIFGMFNFAFVKRGAGIDDLWNFETFWSSLICLVMTSTTSGWFGLLLPMMNTPPDCDPYLEHPGMPVTGDCVNPLVGTLFLCTFVILSSLLLLHLYIAVVMETFRHKEAEPLSDHDLQMFYNTWIKFDPNSTQQIQLSDLPEFCSSLKDPLRIPKPNPGLDLPVQPGGGVSCLDVLVAVSRQVLGDSVDVDALRVRLEDTFKVSSSKESREPISSFPRTEPEEVQELGEAGGKVGGASGV